MFKLVHGITRGLPDMEGFIQLINTLQEHPVTEAVVGIDWKKDSWDTAATYEQKTFGIRAAYYLDRFVPGLGVKLSWMKETTVNGANEFENSTFEIGVDYRF